MLLCGAVAANVVVYGCVALVAAGVCCSYSCCSLVCAVGCWC